MRYKCGSVGTSFSDLVLSIFLHVFALFNFVDHVSRPSDKYSGVCLSLSPYISL